MQASGFVSRSSARLSPDRICRTRGDTLLAFSAQATSLIRPVRLRAREPRNVCAHYERGPPIRDRDIGAASAHPRQPRSTAYLSGLRCASPHGAYISRSVPSSAGHRFSKSPSCWRPSFKRAWMRCCVSGHVSAVVKELRASRSRSADGNETWLRRFFAAAIARRSKEAIRRAIASTKPSNSASGRARLTYPYRSAVSPSKSFAPRTISSARPRPTRCGRRSVPPPPGCTPTPTSGWPSRVLARREAHVAGEDELAAHAPYTASHLRHGDKRGLGATHHSIHQD